MDFDIFKNWFDLLRKLILDKEKGAYTFVLILDYEEGTSTFVFVGSLQMSGIHVDG